MKSINWDELKEYEVINGLFGKFFHSENMTFVKWRFEAGVDLPLHDHPNEQVTMVEEGKLELTVGNKLLILHPGDVVPIAPMVPHGGKAIEPTIAFDIFNPVREDFKEKYC